MELAPSRRSFLKGIAATLAVSASGASLVIPEAAASPNSIGPGWLLCDGQAVSREIYRELFAALGTAYGSGDGNSTFNLPDCRGRSPDGFNWPRYDEQQVVVAINPRQADLPAGNIQHFAVPYSGSLTL